MSRKTHILAGILLVSVLGIAVPEATWAVTVPADSLPPARVVTQTRAELNTLGCVESPAGDSAVDVPAGKPYRVAARDRLPEQLFFCTPAAIAQLTPVQGEVRGAGTQFLCSLLVPFGLGGACSVTDAISEVTTGKSAVENVVAPVLEYTISWIIEEMALLAADMGNWVLDKALVLITASLGASQFITNPIVIIGWPFIQGLANLGFIIALLFIAFATTLGIDNFGARRMLPRLLIAAILINFSLVISGVIIDLAKVFMAIMANVMGSSLSVIDAQVQAGSGVIPLVSALLLTPFAPTAGTAAIGTVITKELVEGADLGSATRALATALIVWGMAIGVLWLAIGLLIRYIMLIFLLIISPLAYLAFAFPNAGSFAKQWWQQFFKYVAYGPVAMFFLAMAAQLSNSGLAQEVLSAPSNRQDASLQDLLSYTVMVAMMFAAAIMSKKLGGTFATAAINFTTGKAKYLGKAGVGAATFLPRKAGKAAATVAANQARDATNVLKGRAKDYIKGTPLGKYWPAKRDDKGKLKPGQESWASRLAKKVPQQGKKKEQAEAARGLGRISAANVGNAAIAAPMLAQPHVADALFLGPQGSPGRLNNVKNIVNHGSMSQVKALLNNKDFMRDLNDNERIDLQMTVQNKQTVPPPVTAPAGTPPVNVDTRDISRALERMIDVFGKIDEE